MQETPQPVVESVTLRPGQGRSLMKVCWRDRGSGAVSDRSLK
jgi:hypothetical protein